MNKELYEQITNALVEDGYIIIPHAINNELSAKLLHKAKEVNNYKRASISRTLNKQINDERRRDKISWLDHDNGVQSEFLNFAEGLQTYINKELFMGIRYFESHFAIYEAGDFYETHLDAFKDSKNRVVTLVYYLNEKWSEDDGGALVVYDTQNNYLTTVIPHANTMVVFLSDTFPHEVLIANRTRYSIAGWFRVDNSSY